MTQTRPTPDAPLRVDQIRWDLEPASWPDSAALLDLAADRIPSIEDDDLADLVEQLALTLIERGEQVDGMRQVVSAALEELHQLQCAKDRLSDRLIELRRQASARPVPIARQLKEKRREGQDKGQQQGQVQAQAQGQGRATWT